MLSSNRVHVAIIGGGITGLSAGWYLQQQARSQNLDLRYAVLERSERWGGKIQTEYVEGFGDPFIVEAGPDSFLTQKPWALQLARELGLESELLGTNDRSRRVFVLNHGKPTPLPDGVLLIVPTKFMPFVRSPLISPLGKLRMGFDLFIAPKRDGADETLADFIRRRLGAEALDKIAEPLMSGIYNAEAERQSLLATFPRFRELETKYGSLIRGMLASRRAHQNGSSGANGHKPSTPVSMFMSLKGGTERLVQALVARLSGDLRLNAGVRELGAANEARYRLHLTDGSVLYADAVLITTPAYITAELLRTIAPQSAADLAAIRYVSTGTVSLAFKRDAVTHPLNGFGLVIPRSEKRPINAITWTSTKFDHRAPERYVLMRVFFGGSRNPGVMETGDDALLRIISGELRALLGIDAQPVFSRIFRWMRANPQYDIGHLDRLAHIESGLPPGVYIAGSPYRGVGIPDCVHQAQQSAQRIVLSFSQQPGARKTALW